MHDGSVGRPEIAIEGQNRQILHGRKRVGKAVSQIERTPEPGFRGDASLPDIRRYEPDPAAQELRFDLLEEVRLTVANADQGVSGQLQRSSSEQNRGAGFSGALVPSPTHWEKSGVSLRRRSRSKASW